MEGYLEKGKKKLFIIIAAFLMLFMNGRCMHVQAAETGGERLRIEVGSADISGKYLPQAEAYEPVMTYSMESSGWAYGSQLEGNALQIYNTLASKGNMLSVNSQNMIVVKLQRPYSALSSAEGVAAIQDIARAVHAFVKDYGEYYWMETLDGWIQAGAGDFYQYSEIWLMPVDYYSGVRSEVGAADAELKKAVAAVNAKAESYTGIGSETYKRVLAAHDYVAELVDYNTKDPHGKYGHTITGGLLSKYNHKAVCECYAKLFKLICNAYGIPCILVSGGSETDGQGNVKLDHMWNYVKMEDGLWYLVDVTWDDAYSIYDYFLAGANTEAYGGGTVSQDHLAVGRFNEVAYEPFMLPVLAQKSYMASHNIVIQPSWIMLKDAALFLDPEEGKYVEISACYPTNSNVGFTYVSSNPAVATVNSNGFVRGKSAGKTTITVSAKNNPAIKASCTVTVTNHVFDTGTVTKSPTASAAGKLLYTCKNGCGKTQEKVIPKAYVTLNASVLPLRVKQSTTALKVTSYSSYDQIEKWTSSNKKVAVVNSRTGKITAKKKGTAVITVKTAAGAKASCKIKVQNSAVKTKKLTPAKKSVTIKKGKSYTVKIVRSPLTATDKLKYTTSNKKVAAVNAKGKITAKKKGRATITVKSASGKKAKITVKVS